MFASRSTLLMNKLNRVSHYLSNASKFSLITSVRHFSNIEIDDPFAEFRRAFDPGSEGYVMGLSQGGQISHIDTMENAKIGSLVKFEDSSMGVVTGLTSTSAIVNTLSGQPQLENHAKIISNISDSSITSSNDSSLLSFCLQVSASTDGSMRPIFSTPMIPPTFAKKPFTTEIYSGIPLVDLTAPIYQGHVVQIVPSINTFSNYSPTQQHSSKMASAHANKRQSLLKSKTRDVEAAKAARGMSFTMAENALHEGQNVLVLTTKLSQRETHSMIEKLKSVKTSNNSLKIVDISNESASILRMFSPLFAVKYAVNVADKSRPLMIVFDGLTDLVSDEVALLEATKASSSLSPTSKNNSIANHFNSRTVPPPSTLISNLNVLLSVAGNYKATGSESSSSSSSSVSVPPAVTVVIPMGLQSPIPSSSFEALVVKNIESLTSTLTCTADVCLSVNEEKAVEPLTLHTVAKPLTTRKSLLLELTIAELKRKIEETRQIIEASKLKSEIGVFEDIWETEDLNSAVATLNMISSNLSVESYSKGSQFLSNTTRAILIARAALTLYIPSIKPNHEELKETVNTLIESLLVQNATLVDRLNFEVNFAEAQNSMTEKAGSKASSSEILNVSDEEKERVKTFLDEIDDAIAVQRSKLHICRPVLF
eukprot:GDKK01035994.1.p1 GENE.GDKK01035994.1~~GDKK01035994.1.p1  ORF type:complete len:660 (-),score=195.71 GDKK01035994.1:76-2034(-)